MTNDDLVSQYFAAVRGNQVAKVSRMLDEHPELARARCPGDNRLLGVIWSQRSSHERLADGDPRSCTALHHAAYNGFAELIEVMLCHDAEPDAMGYDNNRGNCTPLILAAAEGNADSVRSLLDHGADPNLRTEAGCTALETALEEKSVEKAQILLARGARAGCHAAAKLGLVERLEELLERDSALASQPDRSGKTPLDAAVEWGRREIAELLFRHGVSPTPVSAAGFGMLDQLRRFIDADAGLVHSANLLTTAAVNGQVETLKYLLHRGADPNECDYDNAQPLHNVAMSMVRPQCSASVAPLIAAGADATVVHRGHTPLARSRATRNDSVVKALLDCGVRE